MGSPHAKKFENLLNKVKDLSLWLPHSHYSFLFLEPHLFSSKRKKKYSDRETLRMFKGLK
ncbi:hypothetical protein CsatA_021651 [Cannabis sativa]